MIKCVAIDDEPIALSIIREYCAKYGDVELQCFTSPVAGMACVKEMHPDVVFLDIEMNSHNGVELARELPEGTCLIFTTAFAQYAIDGFDLDAVDFLHKPIFYPRFERAMDKVRKRLATEAAEPAKSNISLKVGHKNFVVNLQDILYVEAMDNYVKIFRRDMPTVVSQITMKEMEGLLPPSVFIRVHRSFIVSIPSVERYSNRSIGLRSTSRIIPVGRKYVESFNNIFNKLQNK